MVIVSRNLERNNQNEGFKVTALEVIMLNKFNGQLTHKSFFLPIIVILPCTLHPSSFVQYHAVIGSSDNRATCHQATGRDEDVILQYSMDGGREHIWWVLFTFFSQDPAKSGFTTQFDGLHTMNIVLIRVVKRVFVC